jgi:predicted O-methyltransferase YrrM
MGLLRESGRRVRSPIRIMQTHGFAVAADAPGEPGIQADHVMAVSGSSAFLAGITDRRPVGAALDLGTGTGVQALLASRQADRVVATDPNPRALEFARFNALVNGVENIEFRRRGTSSSS